MLLGSRAAMLLLLLLWTAQGRAVPGSSSPAWAQGQQLSQKLCTLAWSAHPPIGHVFCLQRIHQGLIFYEKLLGSDIFTGEPSLLPDGPVGQLHASLLGLSQLLQPEGHHRETKLTPTPSPSLPWQRLLLRLKILRSLQAFVAVAARVFAHGAATLSP
ncbi:interleukin-23 subunit alpha isoform 2-T2 [Trichechus inunguis]|uniref:Interleukin-23 subunit alpha n=1 Tax=Trichechus manatus latirostris TaxID=127582 RepID=A0A2Y9RA42_TRIMA|nr:interleukin-23 subunit alpha isoform X2 [Trichechus manatus latirostris]